MQESLLYSYRGPPVYLVGALRDTQKIKCTTGYSYLLQNSGSYETHRGEYKYNLELLSETSILIKEWTASGMIYNIEFVVY